MILTGKASVDFLNWCVKNRDILTNYHENQINSDIIEWLDTAGIYIDTWQDMDNYVCVEDIECESDGDIDSWSVNFFITIREILNADKNINDYIEHNVEGTFTNRQSAIKSAIIKANEIYNQK